MGYSDPESEYEDFVSRIRSLCDQEAEAEEFIDLIVGALKGDVDAGEINDLVQNVAYDNLKKSIYAEARSEVYQEVEEELNAEYSAKEKELEEEYERKMAEYEKQLELGVMYEVIEKRFLTEPDFLEYVLSKIKEDLLQNKEQGLYPFIYEATLERINQDELKRFLLDNFKDDLISRYTEEIKNDLFAEDSYGIIADLIKDIKSELRNDKIFVEKVRSDAIRDIARKIFD